MGYLCTLVWLLLLEVGYNQGRMLDMQNIYLNIVRKVDHLILILQNLTIDILEKLCQTLHFVM